MGRNTLASLRRFAVESTRPKQIASSTTSARDAGSPVTALHEHRQTPGVVIRTGPRSATDNEQLAEDRNATMADTLDAALESLRRERFYEGMAAAEQSLRADAEAWGAYVRERDTWLNHDLAGS